LLPVHAPNPSLTPNSAEGFFTASCQPMISEWLCCLGKGGDERIEDDVKVVRATLEVSWANEFGPFEEAQDPLKLRVLAMRDVALAD
jgi:hypothetical protein